MDDRLLLQQLPAGSTHYPFIAMQAATPYPNRMKNIIAHHSLPFLETSDELEFPKLLPTLGISMDLLKKVMVMTPFNGADLSREAIRSLGADIEMDRWVKCVEAMRTDFTNGEWVSPFKRTPLYSMAEFEDIILFDGMAIVATIRYKRFAEDSSCKIQQAS